MRLGRIIGYLCWFIALAAPAAGGLFRVWINQDAVQLGYELSEQTERARELNERVERLEIELAAELAPERLLRLATEHGLARPGPSQIYGREDSR